MSVAPVTIEDSGEIATQSWSHSSLAATLRETGCLPQPTAVLQRAGPTPSLGSTAEQTPLARRAGELALKA